MTRIEKPPDISGTSYDGPRFQRALQSMSPTAGNAYLHWDDLRRRAAPEGLDHETWWAAMKIARRSMRREVPLRDARGRAFSFCMVDEVLRLVHEIDRDASGRIELPEQVTNKVERDRYIVSSLMEEAITSSQLEGAATTRLVAKDMLRSGRAPRDRSERMIFNNYQTMEMIRTYRERPLDQAFLMRLHRLLVDGTLDEKFKDGAGRFRRADEGIFVFDAKDEVVHEPPPAGELPARMEAMLRFANDRAGDSPFVHPVLRAVILHFWLAFDHPFVDGNGRTARALFYWSMVRQGYWLTEYVSISRLIRSGAARYGRAFLLTESDDNDLTYFIIEQLRVLRRAIDELWKYIKLKAEEKRALERKLRADAEFNHRQLALLAHALAHADASYTIAAHRQSHAVVTETARQDLYDLEAKGLLERRKIGRVNYFRPAADLAKRLDGRKGR